MSDSVNCNPAIEFVKSALVALGVAEPKEFSVEKDPVGYTIKCGTTMFGVDDSQTTLAPLAGKTVKFDGDKIEIVETVKAEAPAKPKTVAAESTTPVHSGCRK